MTTFTLITGIVLLLGAVLSGIGVVLACLLVWTGRRVGDVSDVRADLATLSAQHRNLDEIFESYRKRDAQRVSTSVRRAKKEEAEEDDAAKKEPNPELERLFAWKGNNGNR
jgi:hypothetical protein